MGNNIEMNRVYMPSEDIVSREIEGELIIVPLVSGIGDLDDELFTLNRTGRAIWQLLDGTRTLDQIADELRDTFEAPVGEIEKNILGFVSELFNRRMVVER